MATITEKFLDFMVSTRYEDLPHEVIEACKRSVLDTLAVLIAGSSRAGCGEVAGLVREWGGKPEATVLVYGDKVPAHEAVLANATMARALDFDDFHMNTGAHSSATVVPVALATAEMRGKVSGRELITAIAMGLEATCRLRRVPDFCLAVSGWVGEVHATFGAAVVAGKILGMGHEKMREAMGLAYSQAAGSIQAFYDGSLATRLQQGFSARSGLLSAVLAIRGLTGSKNFLEGKAGFYPVYYRGIPYDVNRLTDRMGEQYELLGVAMKPYPTCGFNLGPIENVLDIIQKNRLREPEISEVFLRINQRMYTNVCTPLENRYRPSTVVDAMFSLPYTVGTAVYRGDVFLEDFTPQAIGEKDRLRVVDKVKFIVDPAVEEESVEKNLPLSLHIAEVKTKNGKAFSQKMLYARGFPQKPMTLSEDCTRKLKKCIPFAAKSIPQERGEQLVGMTSALEDLEDVSSLVKILQ